MGKLKYIFLFAIGIAIFLGCKKQAQITGVAGATGAQGVPGPNYYATANPYTLTPSSFSGAGPFYLWTQLFSGYNPNVDYALEVYAHKTHVFGNQPGVDFKLPMYNVWTNGDELFSSMKHDSIMIWYYSSAAWPAFPDSTVNIQVDIYPQQ